MKRAPDVVPLVGLVVVLLFGSTLLGLALDEVMGTGPWGLALGTAVGVGLAALAVTGAVQGRTRVLAPPASEEDDAE